MRPILIYSGTTEGRRLAELLAGAGIPCIVSVATEYGEQVMPQLPGITVRQGRLNREEMRDLAQEENVCAVVDATHPHAAEVTENIRESVHNIHAVGGQAAELAQRFLGIGAGADAIKVPYFRLLRAEVDVRPWLEHPHMHWYDTHEECAGALRHTDGAILLTTGSKEIAKYSAAPDLKERLFVRVLPQREALALCEEAGLTGAQVIAMQGLFSGELNEALIRQYGIRHLVMKESGISGGFAEKLAAVDHTGIEGYVIRMPKQGEGFAMEELLAELEKLTGREIPRPEETGRQTEEPKHAPDLRGMEIALVGIGMGTQETMTAAAREAVHGADYVFGAKRMLELARPEQTAYPYYLAKDVIPKLAEIELEKKSKDPGGWGVRVAILFSGDSGFYSGCPKLRKELQEGGYQNVRILPGISSVSYMAALCDTSWHDAEILSVHASGDVANWEAELVEAVRHHAKVFALMSTHASVQQMGKVLSDNGLSGVRITVGFQLSYPQERLTVCTPEQCGQFEEKGLYLCLLQNPQPKPRRLTHGFTDDAFIRDQVPMTKEETREAVISKLALTEGAVVYDVGSGTGSIAVEIAALSGRIEVYAIERDALAAELTEKNRREHGTPNVHVVQGEAPEAFAGLPAPTHVFIGGSGGRIEEILWALQKKCEAGQMLRIVMTAISLETVAQLQIAMKRLLVQNVRVVQLTASRAKRAGEHSLMLGENPVYIFSCDMEIV